MYQHLMDYWAGTMQDDCYLVAADGWKAETSRVMEKDKKGKERDKGWTCDLVPKPLIVARYFAKEQAAIMKLEADLESVTAQLAELEEEHGGEDGAFSDFDKINRATVTAALKGGARSPSGLSDGDVAVAEPAKLSKARQLKQGMMQELLTGKTRLV